MSRLASPAPGTARWAALATAVLVFATAAAGCDTTAPQPTRQVVVEAYLQAGAPLPSVRLTRTVGADSVYSAQQAAVSGATVAVERVDEAGTPAATVPYTESDSVAGVYRPERGLQVQPQGTYRLRATTPGGAELRATTTVPGAVDLVRTANDTTVYPSAARPEPPQFALTVAPGPTTADRQNVYVLAATSLLDFEDTPTEELRQQLTPFYADNFDPASDTLASLRVSSSGLLNEASFERNDDGTVTVTLPWLAVAFYGPNRVDVRVVDENLYDFFRTQGAQQTGLAPGSIPNVIENVEGGTGVFGSYAEAGAPVLIRRPDDGAAPRP